MNRLQEEILRLFLEVPEKDVRRLSLRCENFIAGLQFGEDEECLSDQQELAELSEAEESEDELKHASTRKRHKKAKNKKGHKFLLPVILLVSFP